MNISKSTAAEISKLQILCAEAYIGNFADHWKDQSGLNLYIEEQFSHARLTRDVADSNCDYYFISDDTSTIGFMKIIYNQPVGSFDANESLELEKIYMRPEEKGKGYGQYTIRALIEMCRELRKKALFLCVLDTNYSSIKFYEKIGFQFHSKTQLNEPNFKEELKGMHRMILRL